MITQAVIYTRFSPRPLAQECESSAKQEERCRAHCRKMGFQIMSVFDDPAVSGGVVDRPGLSDAIRTIKEILNGSDPGIDGVVLVVDSADRLARDMLVSLTIRHEIAKVGGSISYANGTPTGDTPEGRLFSNILAAFAAYERDRIQFATSRGMRRRQADGEWFGKPPVGFQLSPNCSTELIPHEQEQEALETAKEMRRGHPPYTWSYIAEALCRKHGDFRGGHWKPDTIRKALAREES